MSQRPEKHRDRKKQRLSLPLLFTVALLSGLGACGQAGQYPYHVDVENKTDAPITVRYDWNNVVLYSQWLDKVTIQPNDGQFVEWESNSQDSDQIEVEYQGKTRLYTVLPVSSVYVSVQDFQ